MPLRTYWQLVAKRACKDARAALSIETGERAVVGIILTITSIALLWFLGSEGAPWDATLERVGPWVVLILAIYPLVWVWKFIRTPPRLDAERLARIEELEDRLTPQLEVVWESDAIREIFTMGSPVEVEAKVGSITVRNRSEFARAQSVEVSLICYGQLDWPSPISLNARIYSDSMQQLVVNISPGREETFDLFRVKYRFDKLMLGPFANKRRNNLAPGRYKIKIIASAEIGKPVEEDCFLEFAGYDDIEFRRWEFGDAEKSQLN